MRKANGSRRCAATKAIEKKILPEFFEAVVRGDKTFEVRKDEDDVQVGDTIILREWDGTSYTGRWTHVYVSYVLRNAERYGLMSGYCIFSVSRVSLRRVEKE